MVVLLDLGASEPIDLTTSRFCRSPFLPARREARVKRLARL